MNATQKAITKLAEHVYEDSYKIDAMLNAIKLHGSEEMKAALTGQLSAMKGKSEGRLDIVRRLIADIE